MATVRIDSKIIIIFSSRPIISRKRCTDGDRSSMRLARPVGEEVLDELRQVRVRRDGRTDRCTGWVPTVAHDADVHQFPQAVVDVDADAAEGLHQRLELERARWGLAPGSAECRRAAATGPVP